MSSPPLDPHAALDVTVTTPGREGLTGTAPSSLYTATPIREQISVAPDGRPPEQQPAWRQDFPIDWPDDQYVERRDFTKFLVLTSLAFTVGQFFIGIRHWWDSRDLPPDARLITSLDDIAVGDSLVFGYPEPHDNCVLVRLTQTELVAYSQKCTHLACAVIPQPAKGLLHCPCHEGYFDLRSGRPTAGPPNRPLPRIVLEVRGRQVYATGIEWRTT